MSSARARAAQASSGVRVRALQCSSASARVLECSSAVYRVSHFQTREYNRSHSTLEYKFHVTCTVHVYRAVMHCQKALGDGITCEYACAYIHVHVHCTWKKVNVHVYTCMYMYTLYLGGNGPQMTVIKLRQQFPFR